MTSSCGNNKFLPLYYGWPRQVSMRNRVPRGSQNLRTASASPFRSPTYRPIYTTVTYMLRAQVSSRQAPWLLIQTHLSSYEPSSLYWWDFLGCFLEFP